MAVYSIARSKKLHSLPCLIASVICGNKICVNSRSEFTVNISTTDDVATLETLETAAGTVPRQKKKKKSHNSSELYLTEYKFGNFISFQKTFSLGHLHGL